METMKEIILRVLNSQPSPFIDTEAAVAAIASELTANYYGLAVQLDGPYAYAKSAE